MVVIVDYGIGNLGSIANMLKQIGVHTSISSDADEILAADRLILPGVGAFDAGMSRLEERGLIPLLNHKVIAEGTPILGICLGLQLFAQGSEEGQLPGLGWINARALKFNFEQGAEQPRHRLRIPHMGWNEIEVTKEHNLLTNLGAGARFYFVHSYYMRCQQEEIVLANTTYGFPFHSIIGKGNIMGTQFHPEKSHRFGMQLLANFVQFTS